MRTSLIHENLLMFILQQPPFYMQKIIAAHIFQIHLAYLGKVFCSINMYFIVLKMIWEISVNSLTVRVQNNKLILYVVDTDKDKR